MNQGSKIWHPAKSPFKIEYSAELLRQVSHEGDHGILYGRRLDGHIRLLAARRVKHASDLRLVGLERVGIFAVRRTGQVFLTEQDLEFSEQHDAPVALVLAGRCAGFFVREANGTIQAIRSHQEFPVPDFEPPKKRFSIRSWLNGIALGACLLLPVVAALYAEPKAALTISVHEEARQLVTVWSPGVRGTLRIRNNRRTIEIPVGVDETRATFAPENGTVEIRLTTMDGIAREEYVHVVGPREFTPENALIEDIAKLVVDREDLKTQAGQNRARIAKLSEELAGQAISSRTTEGTDGR
jgi:hypothetical protein